MGKSVKCLQCDVYLTTCEFINNQIYVTGYLHFVIMRVFRPAQLNAFNQTSFLPTTVTTFETFCFMN